MTPRFVPPRSTRCSSLVITVPLQMALGLFAAALLTDRLPGRGLWRALDLHPRRHVVGGRVSYIFAYIFADQGGVANAVLSLFAGHTVHIDWLAQTWTGNAVIWIVSIWKGVGWSFIMFLAALDGVPRDLVEASRVDGAKESPRMAPRGDSKHSSDDRVRASPPRDRRESGLHPGLHLDEWRALRLDAACSLRTPTNRPSPSSLQLRRGHRVGHGDRRHRTQHSPDPRAARRRSTVSVAFKDQLRSPTTTTHSARPHQGTRSPGSSASGRGRRRDSPWRSSSVRSQSSPCCT